MSEKRGRFNSSKTRVEPAFDYILDPQHKERFEDFVRFLNKNVSRKGKCPRLPLGACVKDFWYDSVKNGKKEIRRRAPADYLIQLISNICNSELINWTQLSELCPESQRKREEIKKDQAARYEAINMLNTEYRYGKGRGCNVYVLEGNTQPDVCIKTDKYYMLIEGKRSEQHLTRATKWVKDRDQMIRHIDAFLDNSEGGESGQMLPVYGLYIVEIPELYQTKFQTEFEDYEDETKLKKWLPHRSREQVKFIKDNCFLGYVTWERILNHFKNEIAYLKEVGKAYDSGGYLQELQRQRERCRRDRDGAYRC